MAEPEHTELVQATGLAIALIGLLLEGKAVLPTGEFSRHIANLAHVTAEVDPAQGDILAAWAEISAQVGGRGTH